MAQKIFNEIDMLKSDNISDMAVSIGDKFGMSLEFARQWVTTYALANGLGLKASDF